MNETLLAIDEKWANVKPLENCVLFIVIIKLQNEDASSDMDYCKCFVSARNMLELDFQFQMRCKMRMREYELKCCNFPLRNKPFPRRQMMKHKQSSNRNFSFK